MSTAKMSLSRAACEQIDMENASLYIRWKSRSIKFWRESLSNLCSSKCKGVSFEKRKFVNMLKLSLFCKLLFGFSYLQSASTQTQTVTYNVPIVSVLSISGDVTFPNFTAPTGGQNFTSVISTGSTYSVSNNGGTNSKKIVAHLQSAMPTGMTLATTLTAPPGADSISNVTMTTSDQNLVTGIDNGAFSANQIKYTLSADVTQAQVVSGQTLSITYTLLSS